jgi:hypothetical protein
MTSISVSRSVTIASLTLALCGPDPAEPVLTSAASGG